MIKLNKQIESLEEALEIIENRIETLEYKRFEIEDIALDRPSGQNTLKEIDMIEEIKKEIKELEKEAVYIKASLEYLNDYYE